MLSLNKKKKKNLIWMARHAISVSDMVWRWNHEKIVIIKNFKQVKMYYTLLKPKRH